MAARRKAKQIRRTTGKGGNYRPTKKGAGMTRKGIKAYRKKNPGSKLKGAVTGKVKKGSKAAKRRKSYCARSLGQLKRSSAKTRNNPNSRIRQAREDGSVKWLKKQKVEAKSVQQVKLGQKELLIHTLQHMQIWQHRSIVKILTMQKAAKKERKKQKVAL